MNELHDLIYSRQRRLARRQINRKLTRWLEIGMILTVIGFIGFKLLQIFERWR